MEVGDLVRYRHGASGKVIRKLTLNHIVCEDGDGEYSVWGEIDYLKVQREDGSTFFVPEKDCERMSWQR